LKQKGKGGEKRKTLTKRKKRLWCPISSPSRKKLEKRGGKKKGSPFRSSFTGFLKKRGEGENWKKRGGGVVAITVR